MQKIDFVNNLQTIVSKLKSKEIVNIFETSFQSPQNAGRFDLVTPLLFLSKSNFDQIKMDESYSSIFQSFNADSIFLEQNLSHLATALRQARPGELLLLSSIISLYNFHKTLLTTLKLAEEVLTTPAIQKALDETINDGIVIFQIVIEGDGLETEKYIKIFTAFKELIYTLSKVNNEQEKQEIILLDSGSDTNVGVKAGVETAKSLFLIFKEIWEFIVNFRHYKQKQRNNELLESLSIRAEIKKKIDEGVITEEEGKEYIHLIKTRTDDLIGMKVLPKSIVIEHNKIENKKLLQEFEGLKMLSSGEND